MVIPSTPRDGISVFEVGGFWSGMGEKSLCWGDLIGVWVSVHVMYFARATCIHAKEERVSWGVVCVLS